MKNMYPSVQKVKALKNYQLLLTFDNKEEKVFDMKPYLRIGIFSDLKDEALFKTVRVNFDTIEWDNNADFDPESLYELSQKVNVQPFF